MTALRRRTRRDFSSFERAGEATEFASNGTLPRAQERVQQAQERFGLSRGYGGEPPYQQRAEIFLAEPPRAANVPPLTRRSSQFRALRVLQIQAPQRVLFCARRKERREVLFARGVAGRAGSSPGRRGRYFRNQNSAWRC